MSEPNYPLRWLALGLIGFGVYAGLGGKLPNVPAVIPAPAPSVPAPPADLRAAVSQVASLARGYPADAAAAAGLYLAMARIVEADSAGTTIKSTGALRELSVRSGRLLFAAQGWQGRHPEMGAAIDGALKQMLGDDNRPLDAALRVRAAASLRAVAWALSGGHEY